MTLIPTFVRRCALALMLATCSLAASADPINFHVDLDTHTLGGSGYVDFYFGANSPDSYAGTATISHLAGFGPLSYLVGGVSANPDGSYTLANLPALDNFFGLDANFGGNFSFDVAFDAGFLGYTGTDHSALFVSLFDTDFNLLGGSSFDLQPANALGAAAIVVGAGEGATISAVPEPADLLLVLTGLAAVVLIRRRQSGR